jgi:hypothetical protein
MAVEDGSLLAGEFPDRQLRMVQIRVDLHRAELLADRQLVAAGEERFRIAPLQHEVIMEKCWMSPALKRWMIIFSNSFFLNGEMRVFDMKPIFQIKSKTILGRMLRRWKR